MIQGTTPYGGNKLPCLRSLSAFLVCYADTVKNESTFARSVVRITSSKDTVEHWKECYRRRCKLACMLLRRVAIWRYARPNKSYLAFLRLFGLTLSCIGR